MSPACPIPALCHHVADGDAKFTQSPSPTKALCVAQDLMAACGICTAWRPLAMDRFFKQPWDACPRIIHPLQLFSLVRSCAPPPQADEPV